MRSFLVLFFLNIVLALFQTTLFPEILNTVYVPNFVLALCFSFFMMERTNLALKSAYIGGLMLDFLMYTIPGLSALYLVLVILVLVFVRKFVFGGIISSGLLLFLSAFLYHFVVNLPDIILDPRMFIGAFFTFALSQLFYLFLSKKILVYS